MANTICAFISLPTWRTQLGCIGAQPARVNMGKDLIYLCTQRPAADIF